MTELCASKYANDSLIIRPNDNGIVFGCSGSFDMALSREEYYSCQMNQVKMQQIIQMNNFSLFRYNLNLPFSFCFVFDCDIDLN